MGQATKTLIGAALAIFAICIGAGFHYFKWQGVDTAVVCKEPIRTFVCEA
jgi:hypothetical protein